MDKRFLILSGVIIGGAALAIGANKMYSGNLSKNFKLSEFFVTNTGLHNETDDPEVIGNIQELVSVVLQPIRDRWGKVTISSGYRSAEVNKAVGGASSSQHLTGSAADIIMSSGVDRMSVVKWLYDSGIKFGQAIYYENTNHIHVSSGTKRQVLYKDANGYSEVYGG